MPQNGHQEVVMLYDSAEEIEDEFYFGDFDNSLITGQVLFEARAASQAKAAYCVVSSGLNLAGVVFFLVQIDEMGSIDSDFNLPLRYLARQAGPFGELEHGEVRIASRGRCAVPWHSLNLWDPKYQEMNDMLGLIQQRLYRNRLNLKPIAEHDFDVFAQDDSEILFGEMLHAPGLDIESEPETPPQAAPPAAPAGRSPDLQANLSTSAVPDTQELQRRLTDAFGQAGKLSMQDLIRLHSEQLSAAKDRYRKEVENHQSAYLDQLKGYRDEIHEPKVALRQEQSRNRRLQQMLRGDP